MINKIKYVRIRAATITSIEIDFQAKSEVSVSYFYSKLNILGVGFLIKQQKLNTSPLTLGNGSKHSLFSNIL